MTAGSIWRVVLVLLAITGFAAVPAGRRRVLRFWRAAEHPVNLGVARILVMATATYLAWQVWPVNLRVAALPPGLELPLQAPSLAAGPHPELVSLLSLPFVTCSLLACLGLATRLTLPAAAAMGFYLLALPGLFSKLVHYHHVVWFMLLLSLSPCHHALSLDAWWQARRGRPYPTGPHPCYTPALRFIQIHIALIYFFPGLWKLTLNGLPQWCWSDNLRNILYWHWRYEVHMGTGWIPLFRLDRQPLLLHLGALLATLFELAVPFLILWRRNRGPVVAVAFGFHLFNHCLLKLGFWHVFVCDLCLIDWRRLQLLLGQGRGAASHTQHPRAGRPVFILGWLLVVLNTYCGMRQLIDSWPCTCYPTLASMVPATTQELQVEIERPDGSWQRVSLQPMEALFGWARFHRTELSLLRDPSRLPLFWTVLRASVEDPEQIQAVRFFANTVSSVPEESAAVPFEHKAIQVLSLGGSRDRELFGLGAFILH